VKNWHHITLHGLSKNISKYNIEKGIRYSGDFIIFDILSRKYKLYKYYITISPFTKCSTIKSQKIILHK